MQTSFPHLLTITLDYKLGAVLALCLHEEDSSEDEELDSQDVTLSIITVAAACYQAVYASLQRRVMTSQSEPGAEIKANHSSDGR